MRSLLFILTSALIAAGCSSMGSLTDSDLSSGEFYITEKAQGERNKTRVYVHSTEDSVAMVPIDQSRNAIGSPVRAVAGQVFTKPSFDIDVLVVVFKYRPGLASIPSQLHTDFNGNLFLGYRKDWFTLLDKRTPFGMERKVSQKAISIGGFTGIGTTFVSPWTTNGQSTDEYTGFIVSGGLCTMAGVKNLTVGIGIGWDNLLDRDKDIWVYQSRPWYGLTLSLNLN